MINGLMFVRGASQDYDLWDSMGCDGWSYKDVLPYFIKSESTSNVELLESGNIARPLLYDTNSIR